jgi:hypothetical protein
MNTEELSNKVVEEILRTGAQAQSQGQGGP